MRSHQLKSLLTQDDILAALGLKRHESVADRVFSNLGPMLGMFGVGLAVGSSLALLLAPTPGSRLRGQIGRSAGNIATKVRRRRRGNGQVDIHKLSRDELDERAVALGIEGSSAMSREELITLIGNH